MSRQASEYKTVSGPRHCKYWQQIAREEQGTGVGSQFDANPLRTLNLTNLPAYLKAGDYYVKLVWGDDNFIDFKVPKGFNIFDQLTPGVDIKITNVSSGSDRIEIGNEATFCHACIAGNKNRYNDSCWGITPIADKNRKNGCNSANWKGQGIYYSGYSNGGGGFVGVKLDKELKGGLESVGLKMYIRPASTSCFTAEPYAGKDIKVEDNTTDVFDCQRLCRETAGCSHVTYTVGAVASESFGRCWLKKTVEEGDAQPDFSKWEVLSGPMDCQVKEPQKEQCWIAALATHDAILHQTKKANDVYACQQRCSAHAECKFFVFDIQSTDCWLKSTRGNTAFDEHKNPFRRTIRISGPNICIPDPLPPAPVKPTDRGFMCAKEHDKTNNICHCDGTVSYGAKDKFFTKVVSGQITCANSAFGDPIVGTVKDCFCKDVKGDRCATENGKCACNGAVWYGSKNKWVRKSITGSVDCNNNNFGDPIPGTVKECFCQEAKVDLYKVESENNFVDSAVACPPETVQVDIPAGASCASKETKNQANLYHILNTLHPTNGVKFTVKASNDAHLGFFTDSKSNSLMYEIVLGGWSNKQSVIRRCNQCTNQVTKSTPSLNSKVVAKQFWATFSKGLVSVGTGDVFGKSVIMSWQDPNPLVITNVGVMTGWGSTGSWTVCDDGESIAGCGMDACGDRYGVDSIAACRDWCQNHHECTAFTWTETTDQENLVQKVCTRFNHTTTTTKPSTTSASTLQEGNNPSYCKLQHTCPKGSVQVGESGASIPGCGLDGCDNRFRFHRSDMCAQACADDKNCKAFSWNEQTDMWKRETNFTCTSSGKPKKQSLAICQEVATGGGANFFSWSDAQGCLMCDEKFGELTKKVEKPDITLFSLQRGGPIHWSVAEGSNCKSLALVESNGSLQSCKDKAIAAGAKYVAWGARQTCNICSTNAIGEVVEENVKNDRSMSTYALSRSVNSKLQGSKMCTMYNSTVPTVLSSGARQAFCKIFIAKPTRLSCPAGSLQVKGEGADIRGCGLDECDQRYSSKNITVCAASCSKETNACKSFSWLEGTDKDGEDVRVCTRHSHVLPNHIRGSGVLCKLIDGGK